jgi:hypothetical protein
MAPSVNSISSTQTKASDDSAHTDSQSHKGVKDKAAKPSDGDTFDSENLQAECIMVCSETNPPTDRTKIWYCALWTGPTGPSSPHTRWQS